MAIPLRFPLAALAILLASRLSAEVVPSETSHAVSLDGTWRFKLEQSLPLPGRSVKPPAIVLPAHPEPFERLDYREDATWHNLAVPSNWELAGYSPVTYWQPDNAIGLYRVWIDVPAAWKGRKVALNFDGVQNAAEIYLNGQPVKVSEPDWGRSNYHEGGWDPFQAELTPVVKFGAKNLLAVRVYKNSRTVEMDSGDYFFLGGIHRTVTLYSVPQTHLRDLTIQTTLREDGGAEVRCLLDVGGTEPGLTATLRLQGEPPASAGIGDKGQIDLRQRVDHARLWSAEHPNLYGAQIDLRDSRGQLLEHVERRVGIREVSIRNGVLLVNRVPVKLTGICRHELDPEAGTASTLAIWRKDLTLMKAANINAIRTSHYPYGSGFYDLCDEMGFYVADEMAACWCPTDTDELTAEFAQHARELVQRDKNHASVIIWAIGNENKPGKNNKVAADQIEALDTTRPRLVSQHDGADAGVELDDRHYNKPAQIAAANLAPRRQEHPMTYLENPNVWERRNGADYGCLDLWVNVMDRVWKEVWADQHVPGAFLWEWRDRAVAEPGTNHLYHFDAASGIEYVKTKGICDAFGNPRAELYHVKMVYAPIKIDAAAKSGPAAVTLDVFNHFSFTDLSALNLTWHLVRAGKDLKSGTTHLALAPLTKSALNLGLPAAALAEADCIRVDVAQPEGGNIATYQFPLVAQAAPTLALEPATSDSVHFPRFNLVTVEINGWQWIHRHPGKLIHISLQRAEGGATAQTVDETALNALPLAAVRAMDADVVLADNPTKTVARLHAEVHGQDFSYRIVWQAAKADLQELGWQFDVPKSFEHFAWNRQAFWTWYPATHVGRPEGSATPDSADVDFVKLSRPDAFDFNSTKYDCNWAKLTDGSGNGLAVTFAADAREECRGGFGSGDNLSLIVNRYCCPPRDISSSVVPEMNLYLTPKLAIAAQFRVGSVNSANRSL